MEKDFVKTETQNFDKLLNFEENSEPNLSLVWFFLIQIKRMVFSIIDFYFRIMSYAIGFFIFPFKIRCELELHMNDPHFEKSDELEKGIKAI